MNKDRIIKNAQGLNDEKGALSIKLSSDLKDAIVLVAKNNSVPVNTLVVSLIDEFLNSDSKIENSLDLVNEFNSLLDREKELTRVIYEYGGDIIEDIHGKSHNLGYNLENVKFMIRKLKEVM